MQPGPLISPSVKVCPGLDVDGRGDFPTLAQLARGVVAGAFGGHAGLALFAGEVLRADRPGLGFRDAVEVADVGTKSVKLRSAAKALVRWYPARTGIKTSRRLKYFHITVLRIEHNTD